uniref:Uncharacterized protein n=1 Tax=Meloidogyne floridensis TaxID=298350 RepID=A0A915P109_9BILA
MSDFDPKYFSREEIKQFGTILERLREFEKSVAQTLRKMESKIEEIDKAEIKNKNSITATKGNITKLGNKIMGRIVEIEKVLKIDENLDDSNSGDEFQETYEEPEHLANACPQNYHKRDNSFGFKSNHGRGNNNYNKNRNNNYNNSGNYRNFNRNNDDRSYNNRNKYNQNYRSQNGNYTNNYPSSSPKRGRNFRDNYRDSRSSSRERNYSERTNRSPRRVHFERRGSPGIRAFSPYFIASVEPTNEKLNGRNNKLEEKRINNDKNKLPHKNTLTLQEIEPEVVYLAGSANKVADALSRVPIAWNNVIPPPNEEIPYLMNISVENINHNILT